MSEVSGENSNKRKPLGRGLGSLLGGAPPMGPVTSASKSETAIKANTQTSGGTGTKSPSSSGSTATPSGLAPAPTNPTIPAEARIWQVAIDKLRPSPYQPRNVFDKEPLQELAQSIKSSGILQPITARKLANGAFEIIAGERRWRAAQLAGLHEVPVILKNLGDRETLELALIENVQREDLNPIEEAEAYQKLAQEFRLTQQQVAEKVGKDRVSVANAIRLLQLPTEVRDMISNQEITVGHAKVLLALPSAADQSRWAKKVRDENLSVRKLEKAVQEILVPAKKEGGNGFDTGVTQRLIAGLSDELQKLLGTKVNIDYSNGKGKISIHFYSDDELTQIIDRMRDGCQKSLISSQAKPAQNT